jgi:hypothetical protein
MIALLLAVAGCVLLTTGYARSESIPFTILIPSLNSMGAPYWLKEGVRLSYYTAMSTVPSEREYFLKDDKGDWVDDQGRRYRKEDNPGDAGHGITQINVSFADNRLAALNIRGYQFTGVWMGPSVPLLTTGSVVPACQGGDWWVHPQGLAQIQSSFSNGVKIGRMAYPMSGKTYQAIRFEFKTRESEVVFVYDTVTGLLLHAHTCNRSNQRTTLGLINFIDWRKVRYPWAGTDAPSWLAQRSGLQYQGNSMLCIPTTTPFPMPMSVAISFLKKEAKWAHLMQRTVVQVPSPVPTQNTPTDAEQVAGPGQIGAIWINPQALRTLRVGQVIDQDNTVQTRVAVTRADGGVVQITEAGKLHTTTCQYDTNTGVMSALNHTDQHAYTQTTLNLVR